MAKAKPKIENAVWPLGKIRPYDRNPRTHPQAQVELLAKLLTTYGVDQPIVVDEHGVILKGHGRRLAAIEAKLDNFPVVIRRGLTDAEKSAIRIQDNQVALLSGWDQELLRAEVGDLEVSGFELTQLGFAETKLAELTTPVEAPSEFAAYGSDIEVHYRCPSCGYAWSGKPNAGGDEEEAKPNGKADDA